MTKPQRPARSLYRQIRLTATQELSGRLSYSIHAKPLNAAWSEHTVLVRDALPGHRTLDSTEDVIRCLMVLLAEQLLPEES